MPDAPIKSPFETTEIVGAPELDTETDIEADERAYEQLPESKEHFLEEEHTEAQRTAKKIEGSLAKHAAPARAQAPAPAPIVRDEVTLRVEKILEEGMGELYAGLPDSAKPVFKKKGEEAASQIAVMARSLKLEVAKVLRLIYDWLLVVPKANKFYLEQQAKIKTDALLDYVEARKEELSK